MAIFSIILFASISIYLVLKFDINYEFNWGVRNEI